MTHPNDTNDIAIFNKNQNNQLETLKLPQQTSSYVLPPTTFPVFTTKATLPAFLNKLHGMVNIPDTDPWVHWSDAGDSFVIPNSQALAEQVLGRHFKHNNFASFVRQLNMYGFHKVPHLSHGVLHNDGLPEVWEFTNEYFHRDYPERMRHIFRKKGEAEKARAAAKQRSSSPPATPTFHPQPSLSDPADIAIARAEIQTVANRQKIIREEVVRLVGSTESLWKYTLETRQRYREQQVKLDKLIKFLSEAFRKRLSNNELPNKVRGLLEGPTIEELSDQATPVHTPLVNPEQGQLDVLKMIANGKIPVGLQESINQYLQSVNQTNIHPETPVSPTPPTSFESPDALTMYQLANNTHHLEQIQDWINHTEQNLNGLNVDLNNTTGNVNYADYLNDPNYNFESFVPAPIPDPQLDMFCGDTSLDTLQPWMAQYLNSEHDNAGTAGRKRALEDNEDSSSSIKKARV